MKLSERIQAWRDPEEGWYMEEHEEWAAEVAKLEGELAAHKENEGDECPLCVLEEENEALGGGLRHIKRWSSGEIVTMNPRQILDAVARMCDDALLTGVDDD